jgi:DNA-binding PadR family transcriptional regulator
VLTPAGYLEVIKEFKCKIPRTSYRLTDKGRAQLEAYWQAMDEIRNSAQQTAPEGN